MNSNFIILPVKHQVGMNGCIITGGIMIDCNLQLKGLRGTHFEVDQLLQ